MKANDFRRQLPRLAAIGALAFTVLSAIPLRAATIIWGSPTPISADTDVTTEGSLLYAYNFGNTAGIGADQNGRTGLGSPEPAAVPPAAVNGVTFAPFAVPHGTSTMVTVGSVSLSTSPAAVQFFTTNTLAGSGSAPFTTLSAAYQGLLQSGVSTFARNSFLTLTLGGLTPGDSYLVEFWSNDSQLLTNKNAGTTYTAGNAVTLDNNNTNTAGGVGQWVTGTFKADSATQVITLQSSTPADDYPAINALQLRIVPEPSSALLLLSGAALGLCRRTVRKGPAAA